MRWYPPSKDVVKIVVDMNSFHFIVDPADFSGLCRNYHGEWIFGFYDSCGFVSNMISELSAILNAAKLA